MTQESRPYGFEFAGHHSSDFELVVLAEKTVTMPSKRKSQLQLPYRTGYIDLSDLYGLNAYDERTVTFPCRLPYGQEPVIDESETDGTDELVDEANWKDTAQG